MEKIEMKRRDFVKIFGLATGGLLLGCNVSADKVVVNTLEDGISFVPNLFIQLQKDGTVTIVVARSEMGQGIRTSMASAIAEDLEADWKYVTVQQATGDAKFGNQNTDGSRSIRTLLKPMRKMGAMARSILEQAAAKKWNIAASDCKAENHFVVNNTTGEKVFFGDLVEEAKTIAIPSDENIILKDIWKNHLIAIHSTGFFKQSLNNFGVNQEIGTPFHSMNKIPCKICMLFFSKTGTKHHYIIAHKYCCVKHFGFT